MATVLHLSKHSIAAILMATAGILPFSGHAFSQEEADPQSGVEVDALPLSGPALLLYRNAELAITDGNPGKAVSDLTEAVRQRPDCAKLRAALVSALRKGGRDGEATAAAGAAASDDRLPADGRQRLQAMAAGAELRDGASVDACQIEVQPGAPAVAERPVAVPGPAGPPSSTEAASAVAETDPAYEAADAAYRAYARADYQGAVADAERAVALAPDNGDYQTLLTNARAALKRSETKPPPPDPAFGAASAAYAALRDNDLDKALSAARRAASLAPSDRAYQLLLIDVLNRSGRRDEALAAVDRTIARFGADRALLSQRGVLHQEAGDQALAKADFARALTLPGRTPSEADLRLDLATTAMALDAPQEAYQALQPLGDSRDAAVWLLRGRALTATENYTAAATALQQAAALSQSDRQRTDITVARLDLIDAESGERSARAAFGAAEQDGSLSALSATDTAYLAARLGDRSIAYDAFAEAYGAGQLGGRQLIDAAYAARRDYQNDAAIAWLKQVIDAADAGRLQLSPEELYGLRRQVSDIKRRWGANIGLFYGSSGIGDGYLTPPASAGRTMQLGTEFYWRPEAFGYRDGRTVDFFIRQFTTLYDSLDGAIGASTMQGAAGVRVKPFTNLNVIVEAAQYFKIGRDSRDDFLLRAAISGGFNNDLMPWKDQWWSGQYYAEAGSYLVSGENFWDANASLGRSYRLGGDGGRLVVTPFVGVSADFDNLDANTFALGAGPGVNVRYWFRETKYQAPMSHLDFNVQYRARLGGDDRARGWFATLNLAL